MWVVQGPAAGGCLVEGARGWNIDRWLGWLGCSVSTGWFWLAGKGGWCGWSGRDTLLGPEGSGGLACCGWWVWFFWLVGCVLLCLVGCGGVWRRLYVENFTVDASIFVMCQVFKGTRWMPWYQEPKKDVGICDKPRVVDNQTVIRGFPNGETRLESFPVTRA